MGCRFRNSVFYVTNTFSAHEREREKERDRELTKNKVKGIILKSKEKLTERKKKMNRKEGKREKSGRKDKVIKTGTSDRNG